jgi:hypothetical protein
VLELSPAATGTGVVAASPGEGAFVGLGILDQPPADLVRMHTAANVLSNQTHGALYVVEEGPVAFAEHVQRFARLCPASQAVLGTPAVTDEADVAVTAHLR